MKHCLNLSNMKKTVEEQMKDQLYTHNVIANALKESQQSFAMSKQFSELLVDLMEINFGVDETARIAEKAIKITKGLIEDKGENYDQNR